jgi:hypothetical protein
VARAGFDDFENPNWHFECHALPVIYEKKSDQLIIAEYGGAAASSDRQALERRPTAVSAQFQCLPVRRTELWRT